MAQHGNNTSTMGVIGRTPQLWEGIDWGQLMTDPSVGHMIYDNFLPYLADKYTVTAATSGTFTQQTGKYGGAVADSGASTNNQGVNIQGPAVFAPTANGMIVMETVGIHTANGTGPNFFCGLHEADTSIIAADALSSDDYVGYFSATSNTLLAKNRKTAITEASQSAGSIPTSGAVQRYGFKIIGTKKIEYWLNGVLLATKPITSIPATSLAMSLVVQSNGTTRPTFNPYWWACAYLEQSPY
jgi:hypothetical protein